MKSFFASRRYAHSERQIALVTLLLLSVFGAANADVLEAVPPEEVGMSSARLERLGSTLQGYVDSGELPGAVVLVARQGKTVYFEEFGSSDGQVPMRTDSIFRIASQTKALVSVGIMMLQEEGRLLLADPVGKYLPEFQDTTVAESDGAGGYEVVPADRPITIRDLLTHTAGIGYGYDENAANDRWEAAGMVGWYFADRDEPIAATIARIAELPFDAQPGERWVYGYATDILGVVIEQVSGQTLDAFLDERFFQPLGMTDTHFFLPPSKRQRLAAVYSVTDEGGLERAPDPGGMVGQGAYVDGPRRSFSGGAGLLSTANDYARFLQMLLNGGELNGVRLVSRKTVELMTVSHVTRAQLGKEMPGAGFGLGFDVVEDLGSHGKPGSPGAFGWGGAYHTTYWVDPAEQLVVVYMTQVRPATGLDDHGKLRTLVYQAIVD